MAKRPSTGPDLFIQARPGFCGTQRDVFLAVRFIDNALVEKHIYSVGIEDVKGQTGHCSKFVKLGSYDPFNR